MKKGILVLGFVLLAFGTTTNAQHIIKFASLAPDGSTWTNVLREYDAAIRKESGGKLGFRIYPGGVQGEDKDVIRKMRLGQLHSAGLTGVGLGDIASKVRILDSPFLFNNEAEVDHIYTTFAEEFDKAFRDNGYVLLGWAEVGWVYVLTNTPVRTLADMNGVKMWMWEGDKVAEATFRALGISPIPLSVIDVLTSLQTGLINGAYTSPLAALVLQWHTRVKYMMNLPLADASGAVVMTKKKFDELPSDLQEILLRNGRKFMRELTVKSRQENDAAIAAMKKSGIQLIDVPSQKTIDEYVAAGKKARQSLVGTFYDQDFLNRIEKSLAEFRAKNAGTK
ncbi:MAG: TRAP transporter substrate-binding protein DctP [Bacteroidetes bacterium]|nr:TRAP transporter substrate-binding protein DctP [Bacteroidota bacterium]MCW5894868.1 TRAP transporter substrate-binding protein DctP [Bacteroidota bacterium]